MIYQLLFYILGMMSVALAKPAFDCSCGDFGSTFGGGDFGPTLGGCGYPLSPPVSFLPVPQPVPIRVPRPSPPQSVTIPNIIVALLPPNQKPVVPHPRPYGSAPLVVPVPAPKPYLVPSPCDTGCLPC